MRKLLPFLFLPVMLFAESLYQEAINKGANENKNVVFMVTTDGCPYCRREKEVVLPDVDVQSALGNFVFTELNKDRDEYPSDLLYTRFVPSFFIVDPKKRDLIVERIGFQTKEDFIEFLDSSKEP